MGGQIVMPDSLHLDMRGMNRILAIAPEQGRIRVQAGATWRDVQEHIDPHDLSVRIMQSYSNFTVGGSVSVNCHGRYVNRGPLVNSIRAVQLVTAGGEVLELTRSTNAELFHGVIGGYGGLGVVTEVELDLDRNTRLERVIDNVALEDYPSFFRDRISSNPRMVLHNAELTPPAFDAPMAISWIATDKSVTEPRRLIPRGLDYNLEQNAIWAMTELPGGDRLRDTVVTPLLRNKSPVVWRNHEASLDAAMLEPRTRTISTYLLQEYFVPTAGFSPFLHEMQRILREHRVNMLNISIRHSPPDTDSLLKWAAEEVFSFVLYYKQRRSQSASDVVGIWTRKLIDAVLRNGGRYYLPYRLDATRQQFIRSYPEVVAFAALKKQVDPDNRFGNLLWNRYL